MKTCIPVLCLLLLMLGCSAFESKKVSKFTMTWKIDHDQRNNGQSLVVFEFVEFPGHGIGHYSNDLVEHLEKQGNEEIIVVLEIPEICLEMSVTVKWRLTVSRNGSLPLVMERSVAIPWVHPLNKMLSSLPYQ